MVYAKNVLICGIKCHSVNMPIGLVNASVIALFKFQLK
jgi:hypothetical protein